ncbi:unnamed protein product [Allacma fusca]|uniref:Uncharacterized protein n=1 Tax=Allacma fusca TaxID=39272 RepID=A0A8J2PGD1_9HEXA|nr:unnamed protein product [Allacma fusca]
MVPKNVLDKFVGAVQEKVLIGCNEPEDVNESGSEGIQRDTKCWAQVEANPDHLDLVTLDGGITQVGLRGSLGSISGQV